ncbi:hypothetical protein Y032_0002g734 [Ancylostoma ceylanicum]|uniref:Uncharacterized protein n=1 Tax=Ancylostoma ceylanicum TaxID=53326 RepID=A0A016W0F4_9BILA|nr:hypothetical protein Y032_0002g734 [Ancylostoma ceylanicum]
MADEHCAKCRDGPSTTAPPTTTDESVCCHVTTPLRRPEDEQLVLLWLLHVCDYGRSSGPIDPEDSGASSSSILFSLCLQTGRAAFVEIDYQIRTGAGTGANFFVLVKRVVFCGILVVVTKRRILWSNVNVAPDGLSSCLKMSWLR